jgi:prevent-host-death family protein
MAIMDINKLKSLSAREAKNRFGYLIDIARHEPVSIEKHGRPVVVVVSVEEYERMAILFKSEKNKNDRD